MNLKKYNESTGTWDIISSGNASGIMVTDPHFLSEGETYKSVNQVLVDMDDKVEETKRNLSWVVINGTIGGGGGGGGSTASIRLTNGNITTSEGVHYLYSTETRIVLNYLISSTKPNEKYNISVSLDGNTIISNQVGYSSVQGTLEIPNIAEFSDSASHSVIVTAENAEGLSVSPYLLTVVESSISLTSSVTSVTATIGLPYNITYRITNKVLGSETSLIVTNTTNGISKSYSVGKFTSVEPKLLDVNFFDLFDGATPTAGSSYTISAQATTSVDTQIIQSDTVTNKVVVEDGETLVVLIDGITTQADIEAGIEPTEFAQSGNISFSFTPYLAGVSIIYYALRIQRGTLITDIGTFDADETNFNSNNYVLRGKAQVFSWSIPQEENYLGDYIITLRCWSEKGSPITDTVLRCNVIAADQSLIPTQNPNSTMYAQWNIKQATFPQETAAKVWPSVVPNFIMPGQQEEQSVTTNLNVYDTNGILSGFLNENGQSKLRLSGEAYAVVDLQPFAAATSTNDNWSRLGFTLSTTFKSDLHPYNDRTVFYIGDYSSDGEFQEGIIVSLEDVVWKYTDGAIKESISCKIQQNTVNTLDFVVDQSNKEVKIFVNGVLNVAREIKDNFTWNTSSKIYLACTYKNDRPSNFSDVEFYEMNLFRSPLNDKQIVINALNARVRSTLTSTGSVDFVEYNNLKLKNFFSITENSSSSTLWDDSTGTYAKLNFNSLIGDVNRKPPLPVVYINCSNSGFTKAVYEAIGPNTTMYNGCTFSYFDPDSSSGSAVSTTEMSIQIQGTSSTGYRSKNLEIAFNKVITDDEGKTIGPELFQPKSTWMPENQFTLKADVVDSAHANNASIGKWINDNADVLFDKTPPMQELEARRPVDSITPSQTHTDVTIKHTLEGFPVILLIQFDGTSTQEMLGIYSFNLGRAAYYNMGMKFLKNFTTKIKNVTGEYVDQPLPAFITKYEAYKVNENFGSINQQQIYSYEFGDNANIIETSEGIQPTALFMQDDLTVIQHVGEFKFNGATQDATAVTDNNIWQRLQLLFTTLAGMTGEEIDKYRWNTINKGYEKTGATYPAQQSWSALADDLTLRLSIRNAYSYFMICVVFGLVDSLGKNMVLRSWNVGGSTTDPNMNKWYPCFYDMDTANGLSNTGEENVAKTAYIDGFSNADTTTGVNSLIIKQNDPNNGYDEYSSRLWDVLRDSRFISTGVYSGSDYNGLWDLWRTNSSLLTSSSMFVENYFSSQTKDCGELLYNYDYRVKYLTKYQKDDDSPASYANVEFLHGTRNDFVRDWLKKRLTFMDGVFLFANNNVIYPYNEKGSFKCGGAQTNNSKLTVKMNSPAILTVNIGNAAGSETRYYVEENVDTDIYLPSLSSFNTQITVNNMSEISNMKGLDVIRFQGFMTSMSLPSMSEIDIQNTSTLSSNPIDFATIFVKTQDGTSMSDIRHINLSNTSFWSGNSGVNSFPVDVQKYNKLKTIDISNGCVTSLALPNAALSSLTLTNSTIERVTLSDQPFLTKVDFTGCNKLQSVEVSNCNQITELDLRNLGDLTTINVIGCAKLEKIYAPNCNKLVTFNVSNANALRSVTLSNCSNANLAISLVGAPNLEELSLDNTNTYDTIEFAPNFNKLKTLNISSSNICAFQYGNNPVATTSTGEKVLDLSPFTFDNLYLYYNSSKYIKFKNSKTNPYPVNSSTFNNCSSLCRVFGHIKINSGSVFSTCPNFFIHDVLEDITIKPTRGQWYGPDTDTTEGKTQWDNNENLETNITLGTADISSCFQGTKVNIYDVYYILNMCDNVTSINNLFYACSNVKTSFENPLSRDTFKYCGNVTSAALAFYATGLSGPMYSPTHTGDTVTEYNGLLSPLKKLTNVNQMFRNSSNMFYIDDLFFYNAAEDTPLQLQVIDSFFGYGSSNVIFVDNCDETLTEENAESRRAYARASKLLRYLPKLTNLGNMFNGCWINFDTEVTENNTYYSPLFAYNRELVTISWSFRSIKAKGSLINLFGGREEFDNMELFSRKIQQILGSINITSYEGDKVYFPIHNSMFRQIKTTIQYLGNTTDTNLVPGSSDVCFSGAGINKTFVREGDEVYPYDVFKGCINLIACPWFFANMTVPNSTGVTYELPGTIFNDCTNLVQIVGVFGDQLIKYKLTSKGFTNCKLVNVAYAFYEASGKYSKEGGVPYGLFYMEKDLIRSSTGWSTADAARLGITENFGINEDGTHNPDAVLPSAIEYSDSIKAIRNTITNMNYALCYFMSTNAEGYIRKQIELNTVEDAGDLLISNENYNISEYIVNSAYDPRDQIPNPVYDPNNPGTTPEYIDNPNKDIHRVIKNPNYSPYKKIWNIDYYDGVYGLGDLIQNSSLYSKIQSGSITDIDPNIPEEFFNQDDMRYPMSPQNQTRLDSMNYIVPSDLFKYCADAASTNIQNVLYGSGRKTADGIQRYNYGIYGRIPNRIFKHIPNITNLNNIFAYCYCISPYTWADDNNNGEMFPSDMLSNNISLKSVSGLFRGIYVPAKVVIPSTLLSKCLALTDISYLFYDATFQGSASDVQQLSDTTFQYNYILQNISYALASTNNAGGWMGQGPKKIGSNLFTQARHKTLTNVTGLLYGQSNTTGSVPEFWTWLNTLTNTNKQNVFAFMKKSNITNSASIPAQWATNMTD